MDVLSYDFVGDNESLQTARINSLPFEYRPMFCQEAGYEWNEAVHYRFVMDILNTVSYLDDILIHGNLEVSGTPEIKGFYEKGYYSFLKKAIGAIEQIDQNIVQNDLLLVSFFDQYKDDIELSKFILPEDMITIDCAELRARSAKCTNPGEFAKLYADYYYENNIDRLQIVTGDYSVKSKCDIKLNHDGKDVNLHTGRQIAIIEDIGNEQEFTGFDFE